MNGFKSATLWIVIFLLAVLIFMQFKTMDQPKQLAIVDFLELAKQQGKIIKAEDKEGKIVGEFVDSDGATKPFKTEYSTFQGELILQVMSDNKVPYKVVVTSGLWSTLVVQLLIPLVIFIGLWMLIMRQMQSGGSKAMSFGKSKARLVTAGQTKVTFEDVAGANEAKEELKEVVDFLKDPQKFSRLGGKIPKGVLLYGPPGTGKTLLARAVAGEANVPFFSISGSDFVEMFVGVGASRVRDLFENGKKNKPCLIFMDEIDAVGRQRFAGVGGGHDEREQTLNQLLVEMDGFDGNEGVILIAATNRPDVLDPALLRPGRFDRQITVDYPDVLGREKILEVHTRKIKLEKVIDLSVIAKGTPGFSGADLANLVNEAALLAARRNKEAVDLSDLEEAKDRVMMGPERRSLALSDSEKKNTAYHETGHALVAKLIPDCDPIHKVTIIPRGRALGLTSMLPEEEKHTMARNKLLAQITMMLGGRAAEKLAFQDYTTGAGNDLSRATAIAHKMVCEWGMSEKMGPRTFGEHHGEVFLGRELTRDRNYSESSATIIDEEVKVIIDGALEKALKLLGEKREMLDIIALTLIERETLTGSELDSLLKGEELPPLFKEEIKKEPEQTTPPTDQKEDLEKK